MAEQVAQAVGKAAEAVKGAISDAAAAVPFPPQPMDQPGHESQMISKPEVIRESYVGSGKLRGKTALITGGDSGVGRAVAVHFAREGADIAIAYLDEHEDAKATVALVEKEGRKALLLPGDIKSSKVCSALVQKTIDHFGKLDILVNNAAVQHYRESLDDISDEQLEETFRTNIFAQFYLARAALKHLPKGGSIINTTSVTAYKGMPTLLDYSSTKGAIVSFTRALSQQLIPKGIRVNAVAPGPIWTPLIPATFPMSKQVAFNSMSQMGRAGQPSEVAPAFVFLASDDSTFFTGQVLHPNGGEVVNS